MHRVSATSATPAASSPPAVLGKSRRRSFSSPAIRRPDGPHRVGGPVGIPQQEVQAEAQQQGQQMGRAPAHSPFFPLVLLQNGQLQGIRVQLCPEAAAVGTHPAVVRPLRAAVFGEQAHEGPAVGHHPHPRTAAGGGVRRHLLQPPGQPRSVTCWAALPPPACWRSRGAPPCRSTPDRGGSSFSSSWFFPSKGPKSLSRSSSTTVMGTPGHSSSAVRRHRRRGLR